jgi:YVTN family beta-propeller protein
VIDTTTNPPTVRAIPVGDTTGGAIAVSPDGKKVYVGCHGVGVIDTATNTVVATVDVGGEVSFRGSPSARTGSTSMGRFVPRLPKLSW